MIHRGELLDGLVTVLRDIPALIEQMRGDTERITAYHLRYPTETNILRFVYSQPSPSLLVGHAGRSFVGGEPMTHRIEIYMRADETLPDDPALDLADIVLDGIPTGKTLSLLQDPTMIHADIREMSAFDHSYPVDEAGIQYERLELSLTEVLGG